MYPTYLCTFQPPYLPALQLQYPLTTVLSPYLSTSKHFHQQVRDAGGVSGRNEYLGADALFPLLVAVLVHARIPDMHLILHYVGKKMEREEGGWLEYVF